MAADPGTRGGPTNDVPAGMRERPGRINDLERPVAGGASEQGEQGRMGNKNRSFFENFDQRIADAVLAASNASGGLPGYLGITIEELAAGRATATLEVRAELLTVMGTIHGGVMAAFVDHILGCVMYPLMKPGQWAATTEFKLNYLTPVKSGVLRAESTVLSMGRRSAVVRADVHNDDRLACIAQGTLLISDPPGGKQVGRSTVSGGAT